MKLGTENKKSVWALAVLGVVAAYFVYSNVLSDSSPPTVAPKSAAVTMLSMIRKRGDLSTRLTNLESAA